LRLAYVHELPLRARACEMRERLSLRTGR